MEQGAAELIQLAQSHQLENLGALVCGMKVIWESNYTQEKRKAVNGSTVFGIQGNILLGCSG